MLSQVEQAQKQWGGTNTAVDNWLAERQQLLVEYCQIAGLHAQKNQAQKAMPSVEQIESFCEVLMDYVSAGHFEIFDMLIAGDDDGENLRESLYSNLLATTDNCLRFNDQFSNLLDDEMPATTSLAIERLGEILAERFELEDKMINHLAKMQASDRI